MCSCKIDFDTAENESRQVFHYKIEPGPGLNSLAPTHLTLLKSWARPWFEFPGTDPPRRAGGAHTRGSHGTMEHVLRTIHTIWPTLCGTPKETIFTLPGFLLYWPACWDLPYSRSMTWSTLAAHVATQLLVLTRLKAEPWLTSAIPLAEAREWMYVQYQHPGPIRKTQNDDDYHS